MTVGYTYLLATQSPINFFRIVLRWRGSVWRAVFYELIIWITLYAIISLIYRFLLTESEKYAFHVTVVYIRDHLRYIPLEFLLAFYLNTVVKRWTEAFKNLGYIENQALLVSNAITGDDAESRLVRRTIVRYLCLSQVLLFRDISTRVRRRFPNYESIVKSGIMFEDEKEKIQNYHVDDIYGKFWVPLNWAFALVMRCRQQKKVSADVWASKICDEMKKFQLSLITLGNLDWVPIPLAYPQLIIIAVYSYFGLCLIGHQFIHPENRPDEEAFDFFFPLMTMLQYMLYVGLVKVAEALLNPFGDDDDDLELNYIIDKNLSTCMHIVDDACDDLPEMMEDKYWEVGLPTAMYSTEAMKLPINPFIGSAARSLAPNSVTPEMVPIRRVKDSRKWLPHLKRSKSATRETTFV